MLQDVLRDVYRKDSLKTQTRQKRGYGKHIKVDNDTVIPSNWKDFLSCDENKDNLCDSIFVKEDESLEPTCGSTLFETLDTTNDGLDETTDDYDVEGFKSTNITLDDRVEDLDSREAVAMKKDLRF